MKLKSESAHRLYAGLHAAAALRNALALVSAALLCFGCATVTTADGQRLPIASERFADYAESVFRRQNRIATELAFALEDVPEQDPAFGELEAAEESLLTECAGLNEAAAAARDGDRIAVRRQIGAARKAPDCERAAAAAAATLARAGR